MEPNELNIPEYDQAAPELWEACIRRIEGGIEHGVHFGFLTDDHAKYNSGPRRHSSGICSRTRDWRTAFSAATQSTTKGRLQADFVRLFDFAQPEFHPVIGNHEYYVWEKTPTEGEKPTTEQVFDTMCSHIATKLSARGPLGSYVLCRPEEKVCYLTVPCDFDCLISDDLIAFPAEECRKIPEGYACIVMGHAFVNNDATPSVIRHDRQRFARCLTRWTSTLTVVSSISPESAQGRIGSIPTERRTFPPLQICAIDWGKVLVG